LWAPREDWIPGLNYLPLSKRKGGGRGGEGEKEVGQTKRTYNDLPKAAISSLARKKEKGEEKKEEQEVFPKLISHGAWFFLLWKKGRGGKRGESEQVRKGTKTRNTLRCVLGATLSNREKKKGEKGSEGKKRERKCFGGHAMLVPWQLHFS